MKTVKFNDIIKHVVCEDVPNLGSIITLDNKGRLINSQFSKPSASQTLLKLNSVEEIPDADDLPYSIISYGDTQNIINLPYNDHNYCSIRNSKIIENYDKKALEYILKQSSQPPNKLNFSTNNSVRISHFSSYNPIVSQNDAIFFGDKYKPHNQLSFNQQISNSSTPNITNKSMSNVFNKSKVIPSTIVLNSGSINKGKSMNVIQLRRPTIDSTNVNETRIINLPMKKPTVLTNIIGNNQSSAERESNGDKNDPLKSINLIPRCVCAFTHDDGGMIRCEICRTWQHIVCMYPDNKFPIYYKCERCEPRDVDIKRAVTTQTNILIKTGYNPSDFVIHQHYNDYDLDNDNLENNNSIKTTNNSHYVIVKPEPKSVNYRPVSDSVPNKSVPVFISAVKDVPTVLPGSPRTSKRKQDLISLKSLLMKPLPVNSNNNVNCKVDVKKSPMQIETLTGNYNAVSSYFVPTSTQKLLIDQIESLPPVNQMSDKLKLLFSNRVQFHTNLTMSHQQYLKQNNFTINTNMYDVVLINYTRYAVKAVVEFNASEIIMEYNGFVSLAEEYNKEHDFKKHYNPYALFYEKYDHLPMCINSKFVDNKSRYVRRSCTPNAEVRHRLLQDGQIRFYIVPINRISKDSEITIAFDYNFLQCRYDVECACNQPSCQLIYLKHETESQMQKAFNDIDSHNMNEYECPNINLGTEEVRAPVTMTRPYKKRGRGSKSMVTSSRPIENNGPLSTTKVDVPIVRRNKRGRPPLNRSAGIQRSDVIVVKPQPESSVSNHSLSDCKEASDNESVHSVSNENLHPPISIHSNFKNFRRISSSHWSLKTNRKMAAIAKKTKPLNAIHVAPKVGRPLKKKKIEPVKYETEVDHLTENLEQERSVRSQVKQPKTYYNDDYDDNSSNQSSKEDLSRDDEGKYWLQEINNKILKQKAKEANRVQRKSKYGRKKLNKSSIENVPIESNDLSEPENIKLPTKDLKGLKEEKIIQKEICITPSPNNEKKDKNTVLKKLKRGRKSQKPNTNYILSYKQSNIDDLKNDLMLISASLDEEIEKEASMTDNIKEECDLYDNEVIIEESFDHIEETVEHVEETVEHVEESMEEYLEPNIGEPFQQPVEQNLEDNVTKDFESDASLKMNESSEDRSMSSKSKRSSLNKSSDSAKDLAAKASREERWVNTMWQRILKIEHTDDKSKRRRSKSSANDDSFASEDNRNDSSEMVSPKMCYYEGSEERELNSKPGSAQKQRRKLRPLQMDSGDNSVDELQTVVNAKKDGGYAVSTASSGSADEHSITEQKEFSEQCGLIVYKEQNSNPMEKFSRENSSRLLSPESPVDFPHAPHTKKRWLNQALMEETFTEEKSPVKTDDDIMDKLSSIANVSKRSFLPPVFTTADNNDLSILNLTKVAINPKKRLLNQFSREDNHFNPEKEIRSQFSMKHRKSEPTVDQEQAKTKLTLSEYRKRRFNDKTPDDGPTISTKSLKTLDDFNKGWIGIGIDTPKIEKMTEEEFDVFYEDIIASENTIEETSELENNNRVNDPQEPTETHQSIELSYIETLNNLPMPTTNLDPRLSRVSLLSNGARSPINDKYDLRIISYEDNADQSNIEVFEPKSPSDTPDDDQDERMFINGPRTPSESGDMSMNVIQRKCHSIGRRSGGSEHSFESQPSPTSDSHFELEKDFSTIMNGDGRSERAWPRDWTSHTASIGRMAGIANPEMLEEIEEFEDEYIPLPDTGPPRTEAEIETLALTQRRDCQIREWQEVRQLEREKVRLDHQVRSMERRVQQCRGGGGGGGPGPGLGKRRHPLADYDVRDDEKTMKAFNVQLAGINGRLMAEISLLRNGSTGVVPSMPGGGGGPPRTMIASTTTTGVSSGGGTGPPRLPLSTTTTAAAHIRPTAT